MSVGVVGDYDGDGARSWSVASYMSCVGVGVGCVVGSPRCGYVSSVSLLYVAEVAG